MFAEVILHRRVPRQFESFTYEIPSYMQLQQGQIVEVPFRKQKLAAVVRRLHAEKPSYKTKTITAARPLVLAEWQLQLAAWMSETYDSSFSNVIDLFIPEKIWQPSKLPVKVPEKTGAAHLVTKPGFAEGSFIKELLKTPGLKLLFEKSPLPRKEFYAQLQAELQKKDGGLFLFPELFALKKFADNVPEFHGELNENEKAHLWEAVRSGKIKTVVGTRAALFLPFKKLSAIVIDFEHNENYNEKRQPRYNAVDIAQKISQHFNIPLILISATPRVETWYKTKIRDFKLCTFGLSSTDTTIVDMNDERRKGVSGIFGSALLEKMARALGTNKQILLFINRTGEAGALLCRDCGFIFRCGECSSALVVHEPSRLECHICKTKTSFPERCEMCGNVRFKSLGQGTEYVEKEIVKLYGKALTVRLDRETKKMWNEAALQKADIIIATQMIEKPLSLPRLAVTCALAPDYLLNFPHFRAAERVMQLLTHLKNLTAPSGEFIIQTFLPDHSLYNSIAQNNLEKFYEDELAVRKSLSLPPFQI